MPEIGFPPSASSGNGDSVLRGGGRKKRRSRFFLPPSLEQPRWPSLPRPNYSDLHVIPFLNVLKKMLNTTNDVKILFVTLSVAKSLKK